MERHARPAGVKPTVMLSPVRLGSGSFALTDDAAGDGAATGNGGDGAAPAGATTSLP
jgi:hypothetical protein